MPQCVMCKQWFHPDYSVLIDAEHKVYKCMFCYLNKQYMTIEDDKGKVVETVSKNQANESYLRFMRKMKDNPKIKEISGE